MPLMNESDLTRTANLMLGLLRSIRDVMVDVREEAIMFIDDEFEDDIDISLERIALTAEGIRFVIDAHLNGTTNSGSDGLIARLANEIPKA